MHQVQVAEQARVATVEIRDSRARWKKGTALEEARSYVLMHKAVRVVKVELRLVD